MCKTNETPTTPHIANWGKNKIKKGNWEMRENVKEVVKTKLKRKRGGKGKRKKAKGMGILESR